MSLARDATYGLYGALRLARLDRGGMSYLDTTAEGAQRSFGALALLVPGFMLFVLLAAVGEPAPAGGTLRMLLAEATGQVAGIAVYLLAVYRLLILQGNVARFPAYVSAYNWAAVVQVGVLLLAYLVLSLGVLPAGVDLFVKNMVGIALLTYSGFIARAALDVSVLAAVGFVALDILVTVMVGGIADTIAYGAPPA